MANVLNVHIVIASADWAGKANFPWSGILLPSPRAFSCAVKARYSYMGFNIEETAEVMAHEIGHTLGLYHTHHPGRNKSHSTNGQCGDCYQESVSRNRTQGLACVSTIGEKKCEVNGDFLCDTEADPFLDFNVNGSCVYTGGGTDNWGDAWTPNGNNIMSYTTYTCMNYFTPMQVAKMTYYKNTIGISYPAFTITGPDRLCAGETATYSVTSLPGVTEYDWQVPSSMYITSSPPYGNSISVYATHSSGGQISVLPNCGNRPAYFNVKESSFYTVSGYNSGCPNETYTYSVPFIAGANYYWIEQENVQVMYGQYTNTVSAKLLPGASNQSYLIARVEYCSAAYGYGHKIIVHGDPPPPAPQCFAPAGGEDNKVLEIVELHDIIMYPNPSENSVTLIIPGNDTYTVSLINVNGQIVYSQNNLKEINHTIDTSIYNSGIYFVNLTSTTGQTVTKRLIIKK